MLDLLAPFILGVVIQLSAMISAAFAAPLDDDTIDVGIRRDEFAYRLDIAVFPPSFLTLVGAALLNRGQLSDTVVTLIVASAVLLFLVGALLLRRSSANRYMVVSQRLRGVTPLNLAVIVTNVVLAAVALATASPAAA